MSRIAGSSLFVFALSFAVTAGGCGLADDGLGPEVGEGDEAPAVGPGAVRQAPDGRTVPGSIDDIRGDGTTPLAESDSPVADPPPAGAPVADAPAPGDIDEELGTEAGEDDEEVSTEAGEDGHDGEQPGDVEDPVGGGGDGPPPAPAPTSVVLLIPGTAVEGEAFDTMAARLADDGYEPVVWEAPDHLTDGLLLGAERIADAVEAVLEERGAERIHIVAECNGGVASRYWIQHLADADARGRIDQFVTFVSAHHGTWLSPGGWFTGWQSLRDVKPHSRFMRALNSTALPEDVSMTSIYTCRDEFFIPDDTARLDGAVNVEFCDRRIRHFDTFEDVVVYERIVAALEGQGEEAGVRF